MDLLCSSGLPLNPPFQSLAVVFPACSTLSDNISRRDHHRYSASPHLLTRNLNGPPGRHSIITRTSPTAIDVVTSQQIQASALPVTSTFAWTLRSVTATNVSSHDDNIHNDTNTIPLGRLSVFVQKDVDLHSEARF